MSTQKDTKHHYSLRRCRSETQWGTPPHPVGWLLSKRETVTSVGVAVKKLKPSEFADGNVNGGSTV